MIAKDTMVRVPPSEIAQQYVFSKAGALAFSIRTPLSLIRTRRNNVCCLKLIFPMQDTGRNYLPDLISTSLLLIRSLFSGTD